MTRDEIIRQLKSLRAHCAYQAAGSPDEDSWRKDVEALDAAIQLVEADKEKGSDAGPLPLENLEYMAGKPVWIAPAKERGRVQSRWMLYAGKVDRPDYTVVHLFNPASGICQGYEASNYGKTWLAYACEQIG